MDPSLSNNGVGSSNTELQSHKNFKIKPKSSIKTRNENLKIDKFNAEVTRQTINN